MARSLRNIVVVSFSTIGSRVLGLIRDVLMFAALGGGIWNSAFILAFTLPNLFRRLLGEGALTSALIPVFSDVMRRDGKAEGFQFFNSVLLRLLVALVIIVLVGVGVLFWIERSQWVSDRWMLGAHFSTLLLPYMLFICLAAVLSAVLNVLGRFAVPAMTPILLNLSMIASIGMGFLFGGGEMASMIYWLCGGVLLGGFLQFFAPAFACWLEGWRPSLKPSKSDDVKELWALFLPGLVGAAILQINILVSRVLAYTLDDSAASLLYLSSRLMELPLGIFTISVATVFFPLLAKAISEEDFEGFSAALCRGMRLVIGIALPAGVGLIILGEPIVDLLFRYGRFDAEGVAAAVPLVAIYGVGLPFYSAATFATRGFHAQKDMRTPVRIAGICMLVNFFTGIALMQFMGASGLALANIVSAMVQAVLLWRSLSGGKVEVSFSNLSNSFLKVLIAGAVMGLICWVGQFYLEGMSAGSKMQSGLIVGIMVPLGVGVYFTILALLKFEEMQALATMITKFVPIARIRRGES